MSSKAQYRARPSVEMSPSKPDKAASTTGGFGRLNRDREQRQGPRGDQCQVEVRRGVPPGQPVGHGLQVRGRVRDRIGLDLDEGVVDGEANPLCGCEEFRTEEESSRQDQGVRSVHTSTIPLESLGVVRRPSRACTVRRTASMLLRACLHHPVVARTSFPGRCSTALSSGSVRL